MTNHSLMLHANVQANETRIMMQRVRSLCFGKLYNCAANTDNYILQTKFF